MGEEQSLAEDVARQLVKKGWTISVGEVDTGGLLGSKLMSVPGASRFFRGGIICYESSALWNDIGGVPRSLMDEEGPGGPNVVKALARGVRALTDSDIALAESGWAGPTGGRSGKIPGEVTIALASRDGQEFVIEENWDSTDRAGNMDRTAERALRLALDFLEG
ncbi:MAG: CinA family protein, partial [Dehalococcoidia bacterium]